MKTFAEKRFVGGKGADGVWQRIVNLCPPHRVRIEAFAGEAVLSRKIRPADEMILIDKTRQPGLEIAYPHRTRFVLGDGIAFLKGYKFKGDELAYCDPPYLLTTRGNRAYYEHELTEADHRRFLTVAKSINTRVLISGYHSPLYDRELAEWHCEEFQVMTRGGTPATEVLWFNYPPPDALHDYSVVGSDTRQRWRLRKKIRRAVADLASMPPLERGAMFTALARTIPIVQLRSCVAPELAAQASLEPRHNGRAELGQNPASTGAGNGAPPNALDSMIIMPQLLRAYREALQLQQKRIDGPIQFQGCSSLAGQSVESGRAYFVRVEVYPVENAALRETTRTPAVTPKVARAAGVSRQKRRADIRGAAITPPATG